MTVIMRVVRRQLQGDPAQDIDIVDFIYGGLKPAVHDSDQLFGFSTFPPLLCNGDFLVDNH